MYSVEKRTALFTSPLYAAYEFLNETNYIEDITRWREDMN